MEHLSTTQQESSILLVDDSLEELRILVAMLKAAGHKLIISNNGADGLTRAALFKPNLILLDINMPKMDGFAFCRLLKGDARTADIPVIFLTAASDPVNRLDGFRVGAVDYIVKPPFAEEVLMRVAVHLRRDTWPAQTPTHRPPEAQNTVAADAEILVPNDNAVAVRVTCQLVAKDLSKNWTIDAIASQVGLPRKKLGNAFRESLGVTVMAWVREQRMQQASKWLLQSNLSIQGISDDLGFDSAANFSTAFKDRFGATPREYRQQLGQASFTS